MPLPLALTAPLPFLDEKRCHTAYFTSQLNGAAVLVTAHGEIDSASSEAFSAFAVKQIASAAQLRIDLSRLTFFGVDGFSALHAIHADCAARAIGWTLTIGSATVRVLRICDRAGVLPVTAETTSPASLQLVTQPAQGPRQ